MEIWHTGWTVDDRAVEVAVHTVPASDWVLDYEWPIAREPVRKRLHAAVGCDRSPPHRLLQRLVWLVAGEPSAHDHEVAQYTIAS
jgi:hypothetical protein